MHLGRTSSVFSRVLRSIPMVAIALAASSCGDETTKDGSQQLGWIQPASSAEEVRALTFRLYLDGALSTISAVECPTRAATGFECSGTLPDGLTGTHTLELSAVMGTIEGPRSAPFTVTLGTRLAARSGISSMAAVPPLHNETIEACASGAPSDCYEWHRVGSALSRVTAIAATPCQRRSKIRQFRRVKIRQIDEGTSLSSSWPPDEIGGDGRRLARGPAAHAASARARCADAGDSYCRGS
jgi:hypothetical protein